MEPADQSTELTLDQFAELTTAATAKVYAVGDTLNLHLAGGDDGRAISAKIHQLFQPCTTTCVMVVEIAGSQLDLPERMVLKLFDRRFASHVRRWDGVPLWTEDIERNFLKFVASGQAAEFLRKLREDEDFCEPEEGWSVAENETYLHYKCSDMYDTELKVYQRLRKYQGRQIPFLWSTVTLPPGSNRKRSAPEDANAADYQTIKGLLLEYIPGPTMEKMHHTIPKESWHSLIEQSRQIVRDYSSRGVVNIDVQPGNYIVNESVPDGHPHRVVMIDFAQCEIIIDKWSDAEWGRKKWEEDEDGCIAAVMKAILSKKEFEVKWPPDTKEYAKYSPREDEHGVIHNPLESIDADGDFQHCRDPDSPGEMDPGMEDMRRRFQGLSS